MGKKEPLSGTWEEQTQGLQKAGLSVAGRHVTVSHEVGSSLNIPPKMSRGVLEWDIVTLQNHMLTIL